MATDVPSFQTCISTVRERAAASNLTLGTPVFTHSKGWGPVVRVDFTAPGDNPAPLVNRIVCWQQPTGGVALNVAYGQFVPPSKAEK